MGIISVAYIQQALGSLLNSINNGQGNVDSITQSIRDIFSMSTKSLDLLRYSITCSGGTSTRRYPPFDQKESSSTGFRLITMKDIQNKIVCLPLITDGVFGKELEGKLK